MLQRQPDTALGFLIGHGEVQADGRNRVVLDGQARDAWGLPVPHIAMGWREPEQQLLKQMLERIHTVVAAAMAWCGRLKSCCICLWWSHGCAPVQRVPSGQVHPVTTSMNWGACRWDRPRHIPLGWLEPLAWLLQFVGYRWRQLAVIGLAEPNAHLNGTHAAGLLAGGISQRASGLGNPPKRSGL